MDIIATPFDPKALQQEKDEFSRALQEEAKNYYKKLGTDFAKKLGPALIAVTPFVGLGYAIYKAAEARLIDRDEDVEVVAGMHDVAEPAHLGVEIAHPFDATSAVVALSSVGIVIGAAGVVVSAYNIFQTAKELGNIKELARKILEDEEFVKLRATTKEAIESLTSIIATVDADHPLKKIFAGENLEALTPLKGSNFWTSTSAEKNKISRGQARKLIAQNNTYLANIGLENQAILLGKLDPARKEDLPYIKILTALLEDNLRQIDNLEDGKYSVPARQGLSGLIANSAIVRAERKIASAKTRQDIRLAINILSGLLALGILVAMCVITSGIALPVVTLVVLVVVGVSLVIASKIADSTDSKKAAIGAAQVFLQTGEQIAKIDDTKNVKQITSSMFHQADLAKPASTEKSQKSSQKHAADDLPVTPRKPH